jgi:hypothetical protein
MPNIASQIERIQKATTKLRDKGIALNLEVSNGVALDTSHKLDQVAEAFNNIAYKKGENIPVELKVVTDGTTTVGITKTLDPGFYRGCTITPYFTQSSVTDLVLNIQSGNYTLTSKTGTLTPTNSSSTKYNYFDKVTYTVQSGAINTANAGYSNTYVTAKVGTAGWLDLNATKNITVDPATITSKVGSNSATTLSDENTSTKSFTVSPDSGSDTVLTIAAGIYGSARTITVKSLASQMMDANATENDVLDKKIVYSNVNGVFQKVEGKMPNRGGTSSAVKTTHRANITTSGELIVTPQLGYYNTYSRISTGVTVGAATYKQTQADLKETDHKFEIMPAEDTDGGITTYLTQVTVDNSYIYSLLAAI